MKVTLVVLGFACLVGTLNAFPLEETNESEFELVPQVLPNFEEQDTVLEEEVPEDFPTFEEEEIVPEIFPNFEEAFAPTQRTQRPPQIHHNDVRIQAPFAGRLINVVSNKNGMQETVQKNRILYNFNGIMKTLEKMNEEEQNE